MHLQAAALLKDPLDLSALLSAIWASAHQSFVPRQRASQILDSNAGNCIPYRHCPTTSIVSVRPMVRSGHCIRCRTTLSIDWRDATGNASRIRAGVGVVPQGRGWRTGIRAPLTDAQSRSLKLKGASHGPIYQGVSQRWSFAYQPTQCDERSMG